MTKENHEYHDMNMGNVQTPHNHMNHDGHMAHENHIHNHMAMSDMSGMTHDHMHMHGEGMAGMDMSDLKRRFWLSLILSVPLILITPLMGMALPFTLTFTGSNWVTLILALLIFMIGAQPFLVGAKTELQAKKPAMMALVAMGLSVSLGYSLYAFVANLLGHTHVMDFFFEFATLTVIMLLGHWLEMSTTMSAGDATAKLRELMPETIHHLMADNHVHDMPIARLAAGMQVRVLAGEKIPGDGKIVTGQTQINEALVTGESRLVDKSVGSDVIGGTVNGEGTIDLMITGAGQTSYLGQLQQTLNHTQDEKSAAETLADRVASWLFYIALAAAVIALLVWTPQRGLSFAISMSVTVLVIACPHALGLAVPLVVARTKSISAANGVLIKNRKVLPAAKNIRYALMDKTGTLTTGEFAVKKIWLLTTDLASDDEVLDLAAALDSQSTHPLARSIVKKAKHAKMADHVKNIAGYGVTGQIDKISYSLVSARYLSENGLNLEAKSASDLDEIAASEETISYLVSDGRVLAAIAQGDVIKPSAQSFISDLRAQGIVPVMVTGDSLATAKKVAQVLGLEAGSIHAQVNPQEKLALIASYQEKGKVLMIGDGINDAPALAKADISFAIGAGTQVAQASADAVLAGNELTGIVAFLGLAKRAAKKEVQNLWWGAGYNLLAIPLAAGILAPIGLILDPMVGAVLMSLSTVIVAVNALSLRK
ncbi:copper-translocating P-type ATPase [Pseudolactococcus insecticola]|uniref:P-type Cu(+) transporter n=1 Tax=Pseudolactococcus insecticola TaxID=2709158 RepID=A0A6A0B759_9LACT|nr:copper-translocating P-type ATPase [Lactococcus insecticola]GFH41102.1 copper-translocating P-type ATPase [Lactococcus insecticola]